MPDTVTTAYRRLPGLYRRWELAELLQPGEDYHLERAGFSSDGAPLYAVYRSQALASARPPLSEPA